MQQLRSLNDDLKKLYLPLHKLSALDLCNTMKYIVYQEVNFEANLITTIETFIKMQLSGSFLYGFSSTTAQLLVENDLLSFMSKSTLDKMFIYLYKIIKDLKDKSAVDIAYILYKYPLTCLVNKIMDDVIDGQQFMRHHKSKDESKKNFIAQVTGWKAEIVYKIYSQLIQHDDAMETMINQNIYLPLHKFSAQNVGNTIKWWIYNDIMYKENLQKMKSAFVERGKTIINLRTQDLKTLMQKEMCRFMTFDTFNIMFNGFSNIDGLKSKTASDIAVALYDYPLDCLLSEILNKNIDGAKIINFLEQHAGELTGWNQKTEIYQLQSILSRHSVLSKQLFMSNMNSILETTAFSDAIKTQITDTILRFNTETLQLQVNNGKRDEEFSESIIDMVDSMDGKSDDIEEDFVHNVYEIVAKCLMSRKNVYNMCEAQSMKDAANSWICCNCSNHNFPKRIANKWNEDQSICSLCGIKEIDSVVLNIKGFDTFIMVNDDNEVEGNKSDYKQDDIDKIIAKVLNTSKFTLACPNANNTMDCPSFKRLARNLIVYKRWINTIYQKTNNDNITTTIQVNIVKVIDDNTYKIIFVDCASNCRKISDQDIKELKQVFENNVNNIQHVKTFLDLKLRGFVQIIKNNTIIKPARLGFLYRSIMKTLKERARTIEFGTFLSEACMADVESDYYHILKTHVNEAPDKNTIRHTFRFFKKVVHSEDTPDEIKQCRSCVRRAQRIRSNQAQSNTKSMVNTNSSNDDKNICSLRQYYYQSQLDVIHSYLVHSNYKYFTQRFSDQQNNSQRADEVDHESVCSDQKIIEDALQNNDKYVSYGFGVEHLYQHLDFVYDSIYDEMLDNKIFSISEDVYQVMLIKSIKTHKVALNVMMDNNKLICKYFNKDYNIIRNEPIAIRHIFALIMYTDMTTFCTKFRQTYRQMNKETTDKEVTKRHKQFYHYARALFEAIDIFGNPMPSSLKVFHGLDTKMCFEQFTAYFSQPISTTITLRRAQQFSQDTGIILKLKSATEYFNDQEKIPKFLSVSWLSDFPFENEKLFYGAFVVFKIHDIIEANKLKSHKYELEMMNKFQQTLTNQKILWKDEKKQMVNGLIELIERQKIMNQTENNEQKDEKKEDKQESKYKTKYGSDLFNYFCTNANTEKNQKIEITDFKSSLDRLYKPLFTNGNDFVLSFVPITQLFPHLKEIILNEISKDEMTTQTEYVNAVLDYINSTKNGKMFLETIKFQSKQQNDMKPSKTLRDLASDHENVNRFTKLGWSIKYDFESKTHVLTFKNQSQ